MKVGDIYFQQMEKPDRDPQNAVHAEQEYRTMIQDFPDSPLIPRAKQRLREVQEVLAQRQFEIGQFYAGHENWPATIARLQTVADTLSAVQPQRPDADHAGRCLRDTGAAGQPLNFRRRPRRNWSRLITIAPPRHGARGAPYPMAPHVEDAKDRLIAMGRPVPEPTQQELAESEAEEGSRINVKLKDRAMLLVKQGPSTVEAARVGEPTLTDPAQTTAPQVSKNTVAMFNAAMKGRAACRQVQPTAISTTASAAAQRPQARRLLWLD